MEKDILCISPRIFLVSLVSFHGYCILLIKSLCLIAVRGISYQVRYLQLY